jgi:methylglutaconyl-CoA hydratase
MSEATLYELRRDAAWITLNQPEKRNALSDGIVAGLLAHLKTAIDVAAGAGENPFVTVMKTIWEAPKPVIGRINGHAFGGGVGLAAACDLTVAADAAMFSFSEVRVGVIPAMISVVVLPKLGVQSTMWLFLTGERFAATRAVELGLIHRVVPAAELDDAVEDVIGMVRLGGPNAIREAKQLVRHIPTLSMEDGFRYTARKIAELFASEEAAEGMQAFLEKRKPRWARDSS